MTTGSWDPDAGTADSGLQLEPGLLRQLIGFSEQERLSGLADAMDEDEQQRLASLMQLDHALWQTAAEALPDTDLVHLIRFFAVAENLPGWEAGAKSPVIPLARVLRRRGKRLDTDLLRWLREVNENRFLPYGPL
jgi:hypothetical protein